MATLMHDEPEPTPEERDHRMRRKVVLILIGGWTLAMIGLVAGSLT